MHLNVVLNFDPKRYCCAGKSLMKILLQFHMWIKYWFEQNVWITFALGEVVHMVLRHCNTCTNNSIKGKHKKIDMW